MDPRFALAVHHIGARAGTRDFPILFCEPDVVNVLYEPDPTCIDQITRTWQAAASRLVLHARAMGRRREQRPLYIYGNRYLSSFYRLTRTHQRSFDYDEQFRWDNDPQSKEIVDELLVDTESLDELVAEDVATPAPDFLSVDTQGSELEILQGGEQCLARHTLALSLEVSFRPLYEGQCLFPEVHQFLQDRGFTLIRLNVFPASYASPNPIPVGLRGLGAVNQGEAVYLQSIEGVLAQHEAPPVSLVKLFFLAFLHQRFGVCHQIASYLDNPTFARQLADAGQHYRYVGFVAEAARLMRDAPLLYPVRFSAVVPKSLSGERFAEGGTKRDLGAIRMRWLDEHQHLDLGGLLPAMASTSYLGLEQLAADVGLVEQADALRRFRLSQMASIQHWVMGQ